MENVHERTLVSRTNFFGARIFAVGLLLLICTQPADLRAQIAWTTLAGATAGNEDGPGTQARFALQQQSGLAVDSAGNVYVGDSLNRRIRKVAPDGTVATIAGTVWGSL